MIKKKQTTNSFQMFYLNFGLVYVGSAAVEASFLDTMKKFRSELLYSNFPQ